MDSSNSEYLDKNDDQLPDVIEKRQRLKVSLGLKASLPFMTEMSVQGLFD